MVNGPVRPFSGLTRRRTRGHDGIEELKIDTGRHYRETTIVQIHAPQQRAVVACADNCEKCKETGK